MNKAPAHQILPTYYAGWEIYPLRQGSEFGFLLYKNGGYYQSKKNYPSPAEAISAGKKEIENERIHV